MEKEKNITVNVKNDSWLQFVLGLILTMLIFYVFASDKIYDEEYFIKPEYDKSLILNIDNSAWLGRSLKVITKENKIETIKCTELHQDLSKVGSMMLQCTWEEAFND